MTYFSYGPMVKINLTNLWNNINDTIKFTCKSNTSEITFLKILVKIDPDTKKHYTTLYTKHTDTHSYPMYTSIHNKSCLQKILYGQFLRLRRICEKNENFIGECELLVHQCLKRGYPWNQLLQHIHRANQKH